MKEVGGSSTKVQYELRPCKQVERRMLIDAFRKLSSVGFDIEDYRYVGFGAIYYVDFILFHKFLGMTDMLSLEIKEEDEPRVRFNKPYGFIDLDIKPAGIVIPTLSPDKKYILWLDYDQCLDRAILDDVRTAATYLSVGSILLITVDSEPPIDEGGPKEWMAHYEDLAGQYLGFLKPEDFRKSHLHRTNASILHNVIKDGVAPRGIEFLELFNFVYADGHQMITIGGMIGSSSEKRKINGSNLDQTIYIRRNFKEDPFHIRVPKVTRKERLYLDSEMPCDDNWTPEDFNIPKEDLKAYREIYSFFPPYAELLL